MTLRTGLIAAGALLIALLILAFTPLVDGDEGTWQNTVGNIVWTGIFIAAAALLVLGVAWLLRGRREAGMR